MHYTMASQEPQPCAKGVSLSGAMARLGLGGEPTSGFLCLFANNQTSNPV
jgi:hypothetical protein